VKVKSKSLKMVLMWVIFEVQRVNGTLKNATTKAQEYENIIDVKKDLNKFLIYYNFNRRHGSLRKELKVRTILPQENQTTFCKV
jgi:hypothetical protein